MLYSCYKTVVIVCSIFLNFVRPSKELLWSQRQLKPDICWHVCQDENKGSYKSEHGPILYRLELDDLFYIKNRERLYWED